MASVDFSQWVTHLSKSALQRFNRQLVILQGSHLWATEQFKQISSYPFTDKILDNSINKLKKPSWYIYSDNEETLGNVNKQTFRNKLGTESQFIVFYSDQLNIDALAALSGTLVSGGILFIVLPENINAAAFVKQSRFNQRFVEKLFAHSSLQIIKETDFNKELEQFDNSRKEGKRDFILPSHQSSKTYLEMGCITQEQLSAVKKVIQVVQGHRNRPLVLTADRGRGKSSALAIACAYLLENAKTEIKIAITATHRKSLNVFFTQLTQTLKVQDSTTDITYAGNCLEHENGLVSFFAVDELIKSKNTFNLVIVDEAASIPSYQLDKLLDKFHRLVFASTIHGYEGAGRSFTLKFQKNLALKYPEYKTLNIKQPIRWAEDDPLEAFIYELCLLNTEIAPFTEEIKSHLFTDASCDFNVIDAKYLMANEMILQQVFAVLVTAHYQTSPNDLQLLLDNNNITVVTLSYQGNIVGVALLITEGTNTVTIDDNSERAELTDQHIGDQAKLLHTAELKNLIQTNQRRLKDQFIPQSLLAHCGERASFDYSYLRVMRIAIVPELQDCGIGSLFLSHIEAYAKTQNIDFLGTSFGVNQPLLNFWQKQAFKIARIGFTKDKASGEHSALLLKSLSKSNQDFVHHIENNFYKSFDYLLSEQYRYLEPKLVWQIMTYCPLSSLPELDKTAWQAVEDFYTKKRQYSSCVYHLHKWLQHQMKKPFDQAMVPMISKIFQKIEIEHLTDVYKFTGKKAFNNHLIQFTQDYCNK